MDENTSYFDHISSKEPEVSTGPEASSRVEKKLDRRDAERRHKELRNLNNGLFFCGIDRKSVV